MNDLDTLIAQARGVIALYTTPNATLRALYSGGKDSTVVAHLASTMPGFAGVAHVRTMTGPASWRHSERVIGAAATNGWDCITAEPFTTLPMLVVKYGFPGPAVHSQTYQYLKGRPIAQLAKQARKQDGRARVIWLSGIRRSESAARRQAKERFIESGTQWWVNPILDWTDDDVRAYVERCGLTVDHWDHSVDCFCGAYASLEERGAILATDIQQARYMTLMEQLAHTAREIQLVEVEAGMRAAESVIPEAFCAWGHGLNSTRAAKVPDGPTICNACGVLNEVIRQRADAQAAQITAPTSNAEVIP